MSFKKKKQGNPCKNLVSWNKKENHLACLACGYLHPKQKENFKFPCGKIKKFYKNHEFDFEDESKKDKNILKKFTQIKTALLANCEK